jgi:hypothetical protein
MTNDRCLFCDSSDDLEEIEAFSYRVLERFQEDSA